MRRIKYIIGFLLFSGLLVAQTPDSWTKVADFAGAARAGALAFSIDSFGYVGFGSFPNGLGGNTYPTDFWQYNPYTNVWIQKAHFPQNIGWADAISFTRGSKAYVGLGSKLNSAFKDFWEYDPAIDTWTQKANFGGGARSKAIGFSIGSKGYVGLGISDTSVNPAKDFWEYDPATDTWTQKNDFPGIPRMDASGFSVEGSGYVALGYNPRYYANGIFLNDLWQYDPVHDTWTQKTKYPGKAKIFAFAFTIGNIAYLGTGGDSTNNNYNDFWKYDPQTDSWVQKDSFGGGTRWAAVAFSIGNKGYAGTGDVTNVAYGSKDFWMYTPDSLPTGIRSIEESSISIYPDPVSDRLIIDNLAPHTPIIITDMLGQVMIQQIAESTKISIDVSALPPGVYCVNKRKFVKD